MINRRFEDITKEDIEALVDRGTPEGRTLEYKATLPNDMAEFLADVSSFANAAGGDIIFGMAERLDESGRKTGQPEVVGLGDISADQTILRLENSIRDSVEPRIPAYQTKSIEGFEEGTLIIVRIYSSWAAPHRVRYTKGYHFFSRTSNGRFQLDVTELRAAFALSEALTQRMAAFRDDRIGKIVADATPVPLEHNAKIILHLLPISAFSERVRVDLTHLKHPKMQSLIMPIYTASMRQRYNIDGYLTYSSEREGPWRSYLQIFRTGAIEAVEGSILRTWDDKRVIPTGTMQDALIESLAGYLHLMDQLEINPPIFMFLAFTGIKDHHIGNPMSLVSREYGIGRIDRDLILLPETMIEDLRADPIQLLRPSFDIFWQAGGWEGWTDYDSA